MTMRKAEQKMRNEVNRAYTDVFHGLSTVSTDKELNVAAKRAARLFTDRKMRGLVSKRVNYYIVTRNLVHAQKILRAVERNLIAMRLSSVTRRGNVIELPLRK